MSMYFVNQDPRIDQTREYPPDKRLFSDLSSAAQPKSPSQPGRAHSAIIGRALRTMGRSTCSRGAGAGALRMPGDGGDDGDGEDVRVPIERDRMDAWARSVVWAVGRR